MRPAPRSIGLAGLAAGAAAGFVAERRFVRPWIAAPEPPAAATEPPLGSLAGELSFVDGPDGMRIAVESYGPAGAPQVVLAHGWVCTGRVWHEQVLRLQDRFRVVTYDQPGHGRTDPPRSGSYDLDLLGDVLRRVVESATAPGPVILAGHSLGAMAVMNAVRRSAPRLGGRLAGAVLLSTTSSAQAEKLTLEVGIRAAARLERYLRRIVPTLRDPRVLAATGRLTAATSDLSYLVTRWLSVGPGADPRVVAFTQQLTLDSDPDVVLGLLSAVLSVDEDVALTRLGVPTTMLVGSHDRLTPAVLTRRMAERSGAELVELPGVGHMAPLEAPDAVSEVLARHLCRRPLVPGSVA